MKIITTEKSAKVITKRMVRKGYIRKASKMTKLVNIYVHPKTNHRIMFAFQERIDKLRAS